MPLLLALLAASTAPAARPLAAALLVRASAGFRVAPREPAPAGEAEGRRLASGSCDDGPSPQKMPPPRLGGAAKINPSAGDGGPWDA